MDKKKSKVKEEGFVDLLRRTKKMKEVGFMKHTIKNKEKGETK